MINIREKGDMKLLTVKEIARVLGFHTNTIYKWVSENKIPYMRIGDKLRFDHNEVIEFFKKKRGCENEEG